MFFKSKHEQEPEKPKYKVIYKSLYSGDVKELHFGLPTSALANFRCKTGEIWEVYTTIAIAPLDKEVTT